MKKVNNQNDIKIISKILKICKMTRKKINNFSVAYTLAMTVDDVADFYL